MPTVCGPRRMVAGLMTCALAACLLIFAWSTSPTAADAKSKPGVEVVGGTDARTVQLQVCPRRAVAGAEPPHVCVERSGRPYLGGRLTVRIRNTGKGIRTPEISYRPANGTKAIPLPGNSEEVFLIGDGKPLTTAKLKTRGKQPLHLSIGFTVPVGESPSALDGTLRVAVEGGEPAELPVSGEARTYTGVTVTPKSLMIDSSSGKAKLALEGPELLEYLHSHGGEVLQTILYGENGHTARAMLTLPTVAQAREEAAEVASGERSEFRATPEVKLVDADPTAGKYAGTLALPGLPSEGSSVEVALHAHDCPWLLFLIVLLGIVLTGIGSRLVTTAARRKLLTKVLDQTHGAYLHIRGTSKVNCGWDLEDLLAEDSSEGDEEPKCELRWPRLPWTKSEEAAMKVRRLQGLPALRTSILMARSSKDLDEDAARVLDMVARMQRWLRVEPLARRLSALAETRHGSTELPADPADSKSKPLAWENSATARDSGVLLAMERREPEDPAKADELVSRLLFQSKWHNAMVELWDKSPELAGLAPEVRELEGLLGASSTVGTRKAEEQDALEERLNRVWNKRLAGARRPDFPDIPGEQHLDCGITPVDWDASAHLFTGWATLDEPSYGQLASQAATSSRGLYMPNPTDLRREFCLLNTIDWIWTLAILAVASAAYTATTYSDTWGGWAAFASAFLAGVLGKAAVNWAGLPIFQSIRLRKAESG